MSQGSRITLYGDGSTSSDYTFVAEVVYGFALALDFSVPERFMMFNIGSRRPVSSESMRVKADIRFVSEQRGDVKRADITLAGARGL